MLAEKLKLVDERYLLQEQVSQGGPVELYFALDMHLQRPVALEILSANAAQDQAICDRFHSHQRNASAIHHPNVLEVYDAGEWAGRPYLVMERDAGQPPLDENVVKDAKPDLSAALRMTRQVAEAVAFSRKAGLDDWTFSYRAVRIGTSGNAQIALLEDIHSGVTDGPFVSRRPADDPLALAALFRLLISGTPESEDIQPYLATLPASVAAVLRQPEPDGQGSFANAEEVAAALKEIEAASNDYTQANVAPQSAQQGVVAMPSGPDLQRTSSFADAPTLAVAQQSAIPSVPYVPATSSAMQASSIASPAVVASAATALDNTRPYVSSTVAQEDKSESKRRVAPFLGLSLLGLLLLLAGAAAFVARPRSADSNLAANSQAALATPTIAAGAPPPVAAPELLGKTLDEATSIAEELSIGLSVIDPVHSSDIERDNVATQDPEPGVELPAGGIVMVALSLGPQPEEEDDDDAEGAAPPSEPNQPPGKKNNGKKK